MKKLLVLLFFIASLFVTFQAFCQNSVKVTRASNHLIFDKDGTKNFVSVLSNILADPSDTNFIVISDKLNTEKPFLRYDYRNIDFLVNSRREAMDSIFELQKAGIDQLMQDHTTRAFTRGFKMDSTETTITGQLEIDSYEIPVADTTDLRPDDWIYIQNDTIAEDFYTKIISQNDTFLTISTAIPFPFPTEYTTVTKSIFNQNVDGSTTPQIFSIKNSTTIPIDINRIIINMQNDADMTNTTFAGITALSRGWMLRKKISDSRYNIIWQAFTNADLRLISYDIDYDEKAPANEYAMTVRNTFNGQDRYGVAIRLMPGQELQFVVQDDLTTISGHILVTAMGHYTDYWDY